MVFYALRLVLLQEKNRFMTICGHGFFSQGCCHSVQGRSWYGHGLDNLIYRLICKTSVSFLLQQRARQTMKRLLAKKFKILFFC
jgi:hypothetical protein